MTTNETKSIFVSLVSFYTVRLMPEMNTFTLSSWHRLLKDLDYKQVLAAVDAWSSTEKYPPTISDIRSRVVAMNTVDNIIPVEQAWGSIIEAVGKYGYVNEAGALNSLVGACRKIVECFTWRYYCEMPTPQASIYFAQFRNLYNESTSYEREQRQLPEHLRAHKADRLEAQTGSNFEKRVYSIDQFEDMAEDFGVRE